jgi:uncharacterized protein (TIGR02611 family)
MDKEEKAQSRKVQKFATGLGGGVVLLVGLIAIPYPGPGWLIVFAGLAILSREFTWAENALKFTRKKYDQWQDWVKKQHWPVKAAIFALTCIVVITTIWLVNGYGLLNQWFSLGQDWLKSPFVR